MFLKTALKVTYVNQSNCLPKTTTFDKQTFGFRRKLRVSFDLNVHFCSDIIWGKFSWIIFK